MYINRTKKAGYEKTITTNNIDIMADMRAGQWVKPAPFFCSANDAVPKFQFTFVSKFTTKRFVILRRSGINFGISERNPNVIRLKVGNHSAVPMPEFPIVQHSTKYANDLSIKVWMDVAKMHKKVANAVLAGDLDKEKVYKKSLDIAQKLYFMLNKGMMESDFQSV